MTFKIPHQTEIKINYYLDDGYDRRYVMMLFEKLESMNFGELVYGKKGKGNVTKFIPNKNCPEVYILETEQKKRGRKTK